MESTSRDLVEKAISFASPEKIPMCLEFAKDDLTRPITEPIMQKFEADIMIADCDNPDFIPLRAGDSEWGYQWESMGETMGEVKVNPLDDWDNYQAWKERSPDFTLARRYEQARALREKYPNKYLVGGIGLLMMEIINLRGYANYMMDFYLEREKLEELIDLLYSKARQAVDGYAQARMDAIIAWEDWGLQDRLLISPALWREIYYDRMKQFVQYIHSKGMKYILHSCGYIIDILDSLVEMGVDVIQMDQQKAMGFDKLSQWAGKICFCCPVDIQHAPFMSRDEIYSYMDTMMHKLGTDKGGFIYKAYAQPASIHMPTQNILAEIDAVQKYNFLNKSAPQRSTL